MQYSGGRTLTKEDVVKGALAVKVGIVGLVVGLILFFSITEYGLIGLVMTIWGSIAIVVGLVILVAGSRKEVNDPEPKSRL